MVSLANHLWTIEQLPIQSSVTTHVAWPWLFLAWLSAFSWEKTSRADEQIHAAQCTTEWVQACTHCASLLDFSPANSVFEQGSKLFWEAQPSMQPPWHSAFSASLPDCTHSSTPKKQAPTYAKKQNSTTWAHHPNRSPISNIVPWIANKTHRLPCSLTGASSLLSVRTGNAPHLRTPRPRRSLWVIKHPNLYIDVNSIERYHQRNSILRSSGGPCSKLDSRPSLKQSTRFYTKKTLQPALSRWNYWYYYHDLIFYLVGVYIQFRLRYQYKEEIMVFEANTMEMQSHPMCQVSGPVYGYPILWYHVRIYIWWSSCTAMPQGTPDLFWSEQKFMNWFYEYSHYIIVLRITGYYMGCLARQYLLPGKCVPSFTYFRVLHLCTWLMCSIQSLV